MCHKVGDNRNNAQNAGKHDIFEFAELLFQLDRKQANKENKKTKAYHTTSNIAHINASVASSARPVVFDDDRFA